MSTAVRTWGVWEPIAEDTYPRDSIYARPLEWWPSGRAAEASLRARSPRKPGTTNVDPERRADGLVKATTMAQTAAYAQMLCTSSYTAARAVDRHQALAMIEEARRAARRLPDQPPRGRLFPLTPAAVDLYAVGVHWAIGDAGAALEAGRSLRPDQFPTAERRGRMHTDLARAWWQWGKPEQTTRELHAALCASPRRGPRPTRNPEDRHSAVVQSPPHPRRTRTQRRYHSVWGAPRIGKKTSMPVGCRC